MFSKMLIMRSKIVSSFVVGALVLFSSLALAESDEKSYTFGIVPQFDARRIHSIWRPILDELQQRTGLKFSLRGASSIPVFEQEFAKGDFDFAYMNPYHILVANQKQGYLPLVRDIGRKLYGIVVVRKDSPINKVEDLDDKQVAFPAPNALGASLLPRSAFINTYHIDIKPKYVSTHTSVYLNVVMGEVAAGGGVQKTLSQQRPEVRDALRVLYETPRVSPHPVSAHSRVDKKTRLQVKQALLDMGSTEKGKALLAKIPMKKIGPADIKDYAPIGKLGLESIYQE